MTDRDDPADELSSKGFLERWSRKKIDAERDTVAEATSKPEPPAENPGLPEPRPDRDNGPALQAAPKPVFDLSTLPSLESITAATDIRAFLTPGVPQELARAALRRAWAADPAIRGFVGLAENAWDFTDPNAMAGFGALPEGYDVKKLVAQIFGERDKDAETQPKTEQIATAQPSELTNDSGNSPPPAEEPSAVEDRAVEPNAGSDDTGQAVAQADFVQRDNNIASHKSNSVGDTEEPKTRRQHGSALPQ